MYTIFQQVCLSHANHYIYGQVWRYTNHQHQLVVPFLTPWHPFIAPRAHTWEDKDAYDAKAIHLAKAFHTNFEKFADGVTDEVKSAGPLAK